MFRPPKPASMDLNLAPMVDVMMCLIIFFLLASKLVKHELFEVDPPWAVAAKEVDSNDLGQRVTISIARDPVDENAVRYIFVDWNGENIVERELQPEDVQNLLTARATRAANEGQEIRCVINADGNVQYQHVETVLRACGFAKIANIVFSVRKGVEPEQAGAGR